MDDQKKDLKSRRDFLKVGALSTLTAACGSMICGCGGGEGTVTEGSGSDTIRLLSPEGELVEVERKYLSAVQHKIPSISNELARKGMPGKKFVMVIDLAKCNNARNCITGCQKMHHTTEDREWITVRLMQDSENTAPYWFPKACFHCDNPPCVKVCPVDATYKRQDGLVLIDSDRCIGCKFCMAACPYSTRVFNWNEPVVGECDEHASNAETSYPSKVGTVEKCDFCPDMARMGKLPDCVTACPNGVIYYGDQNEDVVSNGDETLRFSDLIKDRSGYRYMEELGTEPRVYYLPPKDRMFPVERGMDNVSEEFRDKLIETIGTKE